jgi:hypothetical protein
MRTKELVIPILLLAGLAFVVVSVLLWLSFGRNRRLVAAKMKLGALLLSFSFFASCGQPPFTTCYEPAIENEINFTDSMKYHAGDTVAGNLYGPTFSYYSFCISDSTNQAIQQTGMMHAADGAFTEGTEDFWFVIDPGVPAGPKLLQLFGENEPQANREVFIWSYDIRVLGK